MTKITTKQIMIATSVSLILVGGILGIIWTDPVQFFASVGMVVFGVIMLLLYSTVSIAKSADMFVNNQQWKHNTEMSFKLDPEEDNFKPDEEKKEDDLV